MAQWSGGWRGGSVDKSTGCCWRGPEFSSPVVLKTVSNSRSRGSSVLVQASWAPATRGTHTEMTALMHTHKIKNKQIFLNKCLGII